MRRGLFMFLFFLFLFFKGVFSMECWKCKYFYTAKDKEPCSKCLNKSRFLLWVLDEEKTNTNIE